jgi:hypothetical protein
VLKSSSCSLPLTHLFSDNITYYKCDITKWEEVEAVAKEIAEEVCGSTLL